MQILIKLWAQNLVLYPHSAQWVTKFGVGSRNIAAPERKGESCLPAPAQC